MQARKSNLLPGSVSGYILKIAYFDCFSGISGDMCLGALVDAGVSLKMLEKELRKIPVSGYRLTSKKVKRSHIAACKVDVILNPIRPKQNRDSGHKALFMERR